MSFLLPLFICIHCNPVGELNILEMFRDVLETPGSRRKDESTRTIVEGETE